MAKKEKQATPAKSKIDVAMIKTVAQVMEEEGLVELLYEQSDVKLQLRKKGYFAQSAAPVMMHSAPAAAALAAAAPAAAAPAAPKPAVEDPNLYVLKSPMVGTFYRASSPDTPPYCNVGDTVEAGKTLCIIEAMKIMNEIKSEVKGKVKEILVENAQAVEYNQHIIVIEKSK